MEFIEHLKSSIDIVGVIGEYVRLRRVGSGQRYTGLCPFHNEKTASFSVHGGHQFYKCFGCGAGGDVIKFVQEIERLSFWETVTQLAERHGIPLPKRNDLADEESQRRSRILEMHDLAQRHFARTLASAAGAPAREYVERRGVRPETVEEFGLGYAERGGQSLLRVLERQGFAPAELEASGLVLRRDDGSGFFDRFRHRLTFPIHSESGKVIAFGGRALGEGDQPKYLNSSESPIYHKSAVLYNLNRARKEIQQSGRAILVEGYMDVIGVYAAGVKNVVATCGTSLTQFQVAALRRHASEVVVNFDPDKAGRDATERSIDILLDERMQVRVLELPDGIDPDEFILKESAEAYIDRANNQSRRYFHWLADRARGKFDLRTPEGRVAAFQFLLPQIHKMPERLDRLEIVNDVAEYMKLRQDVVLDEFRKAAAERREPRPQRQTGPAINKNELTLLRALLGDEETRTACIRELRKLEDFETLLTGRIVEAILKLAEKSERVTYQTVVARLSEADQLVLAAVMSAAEETEDTPPVEQALACVDRLRKDAATRKVSELRLRIRDAERSGDLESAMRLAGDLKRIQAGA